VVEVNEASRSSQKPTLAGIQSYTNFLYFPEGIHVWKSYAFGAGRLLPRGLQTSFDQGSTSLIVHSGFSTEGSDQPPKRKKMQQAKKLRKDGEKSETVKEKRLTCLEPSCIKKYTTLKGLEKHLDIGLHLLKQHEESHQEEMGVSLLLTDIKDLAKGRGEQWTGCCCNS
jgi:hypothetical protein